MALPGRYINSSRIALGSQLGTSTVVSILRNAIRSGAIQVVKQVVVTGNDRLDTIASAVYDDSKMWWVLAAASNVGWGLQVPPGTVVNVVDLSDVEKILS